ncbi:sugar phosphate isomerase/epimerase family protein [Sulfolobus tengchongensis]|uniref:Sugar phosphate isomerase/epimerase family protein n=1 Tax=Sulfolobus tengchongensis TaxID=207809 RepID=A0AAX4L094_9CREN
MEWKLSIISDEISQDFEHSVKVIKELGANYVEVRNLWNKNVTQLSDSEFVEMKKIVEKYGMMISNLDSPTFKIYINDEKGYREHLQILRKVVELSKKLDIDYTRIFTFWYEGELKYYIDKLAEKFGNAIDIASSEGITLVIENEYSCLVGTGKDLRAFLDKIKSKWVKVLWDPGNAFFARETPYPDGYELIKNDILHVHVKDAIVRDGHFVWMPVGKGMINYREQFKAMKGRPYVISLETHYRNSANDPEASTKESFEGILKILNQID